MYAIFWLLFFFFFTFLLSFVSRFEPTQKRFVRPFVSIRNPPPQPPQNRIHAPCNTYWVIVGNVMFYKLSRTRWYHNNYNQIDFHTSSVLTLREWSEKFVDFGFSCSATRPKVSSCLKPTLYTSKRSFFPSCWHSFSGHEYIENSVPNLDHWSILKKTVSFCFVIFKFIHL